MNEYKNDQMYNINQIFIDKFGINLHDYYQLDNEVKEMLLIHYWRKIDDKCKNDKKLILKPKGY